ncbi:LD-carboxypeptidase [Lyngbya aestuarii]|uniref:LD-carboxypeptidase n=1 Tax=Lyngbya aestuarii TaxID=118322 RepID=UPI00403D8A0D
MTKDLHSQLPPPLKPGDLLRVIAPSGPLRELERFEKGLEIWRSRGYKVQLSDNWDAKEGYLAGVDAERRRQLADAWQDSQCRGILCTRGGYGGARLLENWTWLPSQGTLEYQPHSQTEQQLSVASLSPKWLIGFSDITSLLWSLVKVGISSVHGPVLTTLAAEPDWSLERLFNCVEGRPLAPLTGIGWGGGRASGLLLPANLTVATHLLGTAIQPPLDGVILALEDVGEAPYRVDRMLTQWRMNGALKGIRGIALGRFSQCEPPQDIPSWTIEEVLRDRLSDLGIPIVSELPFGHDGVNAALPLGQLVQLDADQGTLSWEV